MKTIAGITLCCVLASGVLAAEKPVEFVPAKADAIVGDWQGDRGIVAQVVASGGGQYQANLLKAFDAADKPLAVLKGTRSNDSVTLSGDGWSGVIAGAKFAGSNGEQRFDLQHVERSSPTIGAAPPPGAVVLFDGESLDAWAKKAKDWAKNGDAFVYFISGAKVRNPAAAQALMAKV